MSFFKDLRRISRASFQPSDSTNSTDSSVAPKKSSSTLSSAYGSGSTPPSNIQKNASSTTLPPSLNGAGVPPVPPRPVPFPSSNSNRNSVATLSSSFTKMSSPPPSSQFAPRITSIIDNSVVYEKVLLIQGEAGDPNARPVDGNLIVHHDKDGSVFPSTNWPVVESQFKALVYLSPGWNRVRLDFTSPKLSPASNSSGSFHTSYIMLNYLPLNSAPPLQLVLLLGRDSPGTFDAMPGRAQGEGNDLSIAIRKFRMAAHLWQAFTAEQMYRHKMGRRCFRFEEEWQRGTLSMQDWENGVMRNEAKVHIVRSEKTVQELRNLSYAQPDGNQGDLWGAANDAVKRYFGIGEGRSSKQYVACCLLDSHWDQQTNTITAHNALGCAADDLGLAIMGSHCLQSYPSCIEEVVPAFMDTTRTDTNYVANDNDESGTSWEAANIGIGAHLHEVGHLFGCPHQEFGVMLRDYVRLNRTFCMSEAYCMRTNSQGIKVCRIEDECGWHRLDVLRFRYHESFRLPSDEPLPTDSEIQFYPVENGKIIFLAPTGIAFIEIHTEGDDLCRSWIEYPTPDVRGTNLPRQVLLTEAEIRGRLPGNTRRANVKLVAFAASLRTATIDNIHDVFQGDYIVNLPSVRHAPKKDEGLTMNAFNSVMDLGKRLEGRQGFKGKKVGASSMEGTQPCQIIFESAILQTTLLISVKVYSGGALDGIEFCYEDGHSQLMGNRGGKPGGDEFFLDTRRGETILGFIVRAGAWIDGIQILTSTGRRSLMYGNAKGGQAHTLMTPRGYSLVGVAGTCGQWMDGFQIIIGR